VTIPHRVKIPEIGAIDTREHIDGASISSPISSIHTERAGKLHVRFSVGPRRAGG
jgi:hypothetical protein